MTTLALLLVAGFTVLAGVLRAAGTSLVLTPRADALHDAGEGVSGAERVADLLDRREIIAPALGVVHSAVLMAAAIPGTWLVATRLAGTMLVGAMVLLGLALVMLGDLVPRAIGRARPRTLAYRFVWLLDPAIALGSRATDMLTEEEGDEEVDDADHEERELISSVLQFSDTLVREVMVPRTDMVAVPQDASIAELLEIVAEHGFSRLPVTGEDIDDIVGMVIVKDLLPGMGSGPEPKTVADVMRPVDYVPETKRVSDLLREMQASKAHMAVVVDEYGGTAGLVTIEDLLEELVGEIVDEYDEEEPLIVPEGDGVWRVDARFGVEELSEEVGADLPDEDWDTVGGLVLGLAGRVPREGERFDVDGVSLVVTRVQGRRVSEVLVEKGHGTEDSR